MSTHMTADEIEHRFGFHKATIEGDNATLPKHVEVRKLYKEFATKLTEILGTHPTRETEELFTALQEASMWTHCAIAMDAPLVEE